MTDLNQFEGEEMRQKAEEVAARAEKAVEESVTAAGTADQTVDELAQAAERAVNETQQAAEQAVGNAPGSYSYTYQPPQPTIAPPPVMQQPASGQQPTFGQQPASGQQPAPNQEPVAGAWQYTQSAGQYDQQQAPSQQGQYQPPVSGQQQATGQQQGQYGYGQQYQYGQQQQPYGQQPYGQYPSPYGYEQKSKLVAGLLGIFLGGLGIHNFYLGFNTKAIIQIVVTFVTCGLGSIWGFVEGILYLCGSMNTDANGVILKS